MMLADIFPTGYEATVRAKVLPGDTVVVYGAGPVGLMAAYSTSSLRGAARVLVVDRVPERLNSSRRSGGIPINDADTSPVDQVLDLTNGEADKGCECVGYQAHDVEGHEHPNMTMNNLVASVKATGAIGVVEVFTPKIRRAPTGWSATARSPSRWAASAKGPRWAPGRRT